MAGIKFGKPLILLMKKDEPSKECFKDIANDSLESTVGVIAKDCI
jgi:hypothetical protein